MLTTIREVLALIYEYMWTFVVIVMSIIFAWILMKSPPQKRGVFLAAGEWECVAATVSPEPKCTNYKRVK